METDESPGRTYALAATLTLLAVVAVILRIYARHKSKVDLGWDDCMVLFGLVRPLHDPVIRLGVGLS